MLVFLLHPSGSSLRPSPPCSQKANFHELPHTGSPLCAVRGRNRLGVSGWNIERLIPSPHVPRKSFTKGSDHLGMKFYHISKLKSLSGKDRKHKNSAQTKEVINTIYRCCRCSVAKLCPTFCNSMDCRMSGTSVLHHLLDFVQIHVH